MNTIVKYTFTALIGTALLASTLAVQANTTITRYVMTDTLGNPVAKTDSTGEVIWRQSYTPYGQQYQQADPDGPGFTGHRNDAATGLVYMQARYYDPKLGRFLSVDPVQFNGGGSGHFNLYWYANGNPMRFTDPDGRDITITINRDTYTNESITSTVTVTGTNTKMSFSGFSLENSRGGFKHDKDPLAPGVYQGKARLFGKLGFRIELQNTPNYHHLEFHAGNTADDVHGCIAGGESRSEDHVGQSRAALSKVLDILVSDSDNSGNLIQDDKIKVVVKADNKSLKNPPKTDLSKHQK